ncbi:hypothetical protein GCK72_025552 [Caenorhabditis remanei]|uniref:CWH43-like N-terminal domain-containing protein n=1 Tax=Caenorhabditis remanei TaxID=31234 RepID=A0A6A5G2Y8_CAERE|nr:hypothetical protein GCK72_025552 [Caenorhabditis remanei]KAF1749085.1 hypothetical protein GCK72_025552 [Caenorhabditis remanei]
MRFFGLSDLNFGLLPVLIALIFFFQTFIVCTIPIVKYAVDPSMSYFPSEADNRFQSCVFVIGGNTSAFLISIMVFVRYRQMRSIFYQRDMRYLFCWNAVGKWLGYLSAIGLFVVTNVEKTHISPVHSPAALVMFGGFTIYIIFQCYFTYITSPEITLYTVFICRVVCTAMAGLYFVTSFVCDITSFKLFHQKYSDLKTPDTWDGHFSQPGLGFRVISVVAEWCCAVFQLVFMVSFGPEFEKISAVPSAPPWLGSALLSNYKTCIPAFVCGITVSALFHQKYSDVKTPDTWDGHFNQPGLGFCVISVVVEWCCAVFQMAFMISFGPEFEKISLEYFLRFEFTDQENRDFSSIIDENGLHNGLPPDNN